MERLECRDLTPNFSNSTLFCILDIVSVVNCFIYFVMEELSNLPLNGGKQADTLTAWSFWQPSDRDHLLENFIVLWH